MRKIEFKGYIYIDEEKSDNGLDVIEELETQLQYCNEAVLWSFEEISNKAVKVSYKKEEYQ